MMNLFEARILFRKLYQKELEKISGVKQSRISLIENGLIEASENERMKLESALGLPIDWESTRERKLYTTKESIIMSDEKRVRSFLINQYGEKQAIERLRGMSAKEILELNEQLEASGLGVPEMPKPVWKEDGRPCFEQFKE